MLREALRYPFRGDRGDVLETLAVGGGLHLLAVYVPVLPLVPVVGYLVGVLRDGADGEADGVDGADGEVDGVDGEADGTDIVDGARSADGAGDTGGTDGAEGAEGADDSDGAFPLFRQPRRLLRDGVLGSVVCLVYLLPPLALLLATVGRAAVEGVPADVPPALFVVASTLALLSAAAFAYLLPAALVGLARAGLRAAFAPRELLAAVTNGRYFYAWVVGAATVGTAAALAPGLNRVALGFFVLFYAEVVAAAAWADGVGGNRFTSAP